MKIPFGKHKGKHIEKLSRSYLEWMVKSLKGGDFHEYAMHAEKVLNSNAIRLEVESEDLDQSATEFLKEHGYDKHGR